MVAAGSALGGVARWSVTLAAAKLFGPKFPYGTIAVNLIGAFLIGFLAALGRERPGFASDGFVAFSVAGVLGGFTTYSAFNEQTLTLLREGRSGAALLNLVVTVVGCLICGAAGFWVARGA